MERIGVRELRQHASRYLAKVKAGETIEVTERGRLVAVLAPPNPGQTAYERLVAEGKLIPARRPSGPLPERRPAPPGAPTTQEALDAEREERL